MHGQEVVRSVKTPLVLGDDLIGRIDPTAIGRFEVIFEVIMEVLLQDLRYGIKALLKHPLFSAIAIATLALGIGANTAIFSVVDAILLRQLPYKNPGRLVALHENWTSGEEANVSLPNFLDWRDQNQVFEQMAAYR